MSRKPILMPNDPEWDEFADALWRTVGLCMGTHYFTERLLEARGFNVEASLAVYEARGGYCDCEVRFNVDPCDA